MNNSLIAIESTMELQEVDNTTRFREKESELIAIIEALDAIAESKEWKVLKEKIFDGLVDRLRRLRENEIETDGKKSLNGPSIHYLSGQLKWAKTYSDLSTLANIYKQELTNIKEKLNAT